MDYQNIIFEIKDRVCRISLNRPEKLNALSKPLRKVLDTALDEAESDDAVAVIVIKGAGSYF